MRLDINIYINSIYRPSCTAQNRLQRRFIVHGPRPWIWLLPEVILVTTLFPNVLQAAIPTTAIKINMITYSFYTLEKLAHVIFSHFFSLLQSHNGKEKHSYDT